MKADAFTLVIRLQKTSWRSPIYSSWAYVFKTFSRRKTSCKNIFKASSRRLQDVLKTSLRRLQDVFKTSSRRLQNVFKTSYKNIFKTSSRGFQDLLQRYLPDVFKAYLQVKLFLLTSIREVLQRRLPTEGFAWVTLMRSLWSVYKICKSDKNFSSFSFLLYNTF